MKKILLFIVCISASAATMAQRNPDRDRKWSLGTSLLPVFQPGSEIGVSLKRMAGPGVIRLYTSSRVATDERDSLKNNSNSFKAALGYEWRKSEGNFGVYYGGDLMFQADNSLVKTFGSYTKTETRLFGAQLFIGFSYKINRRLSLTSEIGKAYLAGNTNVYNVEGGTAVKNKTSLDAFNTRQVLMINYHF